MVKHVDHKNFLTLPKVCQGNSINPCQKVFGKTKHFARYVLASWLWWRLLFLTYWLKIPAWTIPPILYNCYTWHLLSYPSKPVNSNSSAKVVPPFKTSRTARLRFQQSSFCQAQEYSWNFSCLIVLLSPWKAEKFPITGWKAWKKGKRKIFRIWQQQISTTDW